MGEDIESLLRDQYINPGYEEKIFDAHWARVASPSDYDVKSLDCGTA